MNNQPINPSPKTPEKDLGKDLVTFEKQPTKTKELEILQLQSDKATGQESLTLQKAIKQKSPPGTPKK